MSTAGRSSANELSKRERQIIEAIYGLKAGSVGEVRRAIPDPPSYSAVRTLMNILVRKGKLTHRKQGKKYVYFPLVRRQKARQFEVRRLLKVYFDNSVADAVSGLIRADRRNLTDEDYAKLLELIRKARKRESKKRLGERGQRNVNDIAPMAGRSSLPP